MKRKKNQTKNLRKGKIAKITVTSELCSSLIYYEHDWRPVLDSYLGNLKTQHFYREVRLVPPKQKEELVQFSLEKECIISSSRKLPVGKEILLRLGQTVTVWDYELPLLIVGLSNWSCGPFTIHLKHIEIVLNNEQAEFLSKNSKAKRVSSNELVQCQRKNLLHVYEEIDVNTTFSDGIQFFLSQMQLFHDKKQQIERAKQIAKHQHQKTSSPESPQSPINYQEPYRPYASPKVSPQVKSSNNCPNCGYSLKISNQKFCGSCGYQFNRCAFCGTEFDCEQRFCHNCGKNQFKSNYLRCFII